VGAWQPGAPADPRQLDGLERQLARPLDIVMWYQGWGAANRDVDIVQLRTTAARGALPMVSWEPWDYLRGRSQPEFAPARIAAGDFDTYITSWATALRDYGSPVLLRFAHEMNGTWYPWSAGANGNQPADFIAAWRRIVMRFHDAGASNVRWVWAVNVASPTTTPFGVCYPGDEYVDAVGLDGYNAGQAASAAGWGGWLGFDAVFGPSYAALRNLTSRPVVITEMGCGEEGGDKAEWIRETFTRQLPEQFSDVRGFVWFNEPKEADWRVDSSPAALTAFREALRNPHYG
jgi:beta-mannanase